MIHMLHLKIVHQFLPEINDVFIDEANHIYTAIPVYNLIEHCDNYSDTSGVYGSLNEMIFQLIMLI